MGFCNPAQFSNFFLYPVSFFQFFKKCFDLPANCLSLMKITPLLQNVCSLVGSILEACWRKVPFSENFLPKGPSLGKLLFGATLLSGPGLLEKLILRPPLLLFCGGGPWRKGLDSPLPIDLNNSCDF